MTAHREPRRSYGSDTTDEYDTLVEATEQEDGTIRLEVVVIDKTEAAP